MSQKSNKRPGLFKRMFGFFKTKKAKYNLMPASNSRNSINNNTGLKKIGKKTFMVFDGDTPIIDDARYIYDFLNKNNYTDMAKKFGEVLDTYDEEKNLTVLFFKSTSEKEKTNKYFTGLSLDEYNIIELPKHVYNAIIYVLDEKNKHKYRNVKYTVNGKNIYKTVLCSGLVNIIKNYVAITSNLQKLYNDIRWSIYNKPGISNTIFEYRYNQLYVPVARHSRFQRRNSIFNKNLQRNGTNSYSQAAARSASNKMTTPRRYNSSNA